MFSWCAEMPSVGHQPMWSLMFRLKPARAPMSSRVDPAPAGEYAMPTVPPTENRPLMK